MAKYTLFIASRGKNCVHVLLELGCILGVLMTDVWLCSPVEQSDEGSVGWVQQLRRVECQVYTARDWWVTLSSTANVSCCQLLTLTTLCGFDLDIFYLRLVVHTLRRSLVSMSLVGSLDTSASCRLVQGSASANVTLCYMGPETPRIRELTLK